MSGRINHALLTSALAQHGPWRFWQGPRLV